MRQTVAENMRRARLTAGLLQEEIADAAGVDRTYVSALENCRYSTPIDLFERLAAALRITPALLLEDVGDVSADVTST